jgi:hypothetical protein
VPRKPDPSSPPPPPPAIGSDRLLHYAILDDSVSVASNHGLLFVDGQEIGKVPCLAICQSKHSSDVVLYYCERDWNSLAVSVHDSVANAKRRAEHIYPRSFQRWVEANISEQDAANYLDELYKDFRCSFCGKRGDLANQMFGAGNNGSVQICDECVSEFHTALGNNPAGQSD